MDMGTGLVRRLRLCYKKVHLKIKHSRSIFILWFFFLLQSDDKNNKIIIGLHRQGEQLQQRVTNCKGGGSISGRNCPPKFGNAVEKIWAQQEEKKMERESKKDSLLVLIDSASSTKKGPKRPMQAMEMKF